MSSRSPTGGTPGLGPGFAGAASARAVSGAAAAGAGAVGGPGAPPFALPGSHFAAALCLWLAGALGLVWVAPELAGGLYPLPRVLAVVHLFTLGWITLSIQGALYQFLPVALGTPIRWGRLAQAGWAPHAAGVALFAWGLLANGSVLRLAGAVLFGSALLVFVGNLASTLARAERRDLTWWALAGAAVYLAATVVLGAALAVNLGSGMLGASRGPALGVHLHVALFGWVLLVMIGVARHLLPMFLLSHAAPVLPGRLAAIGVGVGTAALLVLHHAPAMWSRWLPAVLLAGGFVAFLVQAAGHFRRRRKPRLDAGMRLAGAGLVILAVALVQAPFALAGGAGATHAWTGYVAALILGSSLFIAGHYYKIVPFLVWFHRFGPLAGTRALPRVADLYAARAANAAVVLLAAGTGVLVAGIALQSGLVVRAGAATYALGSLLEAWQMLQLSRRRPE